MEKENIAYKCLEILYDLEEKFFLDTNHPEGAKAFGNVIENLIVGNTICEIKINIELTKIASKK